MPNSTYVQHLPKDEENNTKLWESIHNELKEEYERENNFKYDLVMQSRLDLCWTDKLVFQEEFNPNYFYTSTPIQSGKTELPDRWFVSDSYKMDKFSKMYDLLNFGKYNFYIWTSYLLTFSAILLILLRTGFLYRKYKRLIKKLK